MFLFLQNWRATLIPIDRRADRVARYLWHPVRVLGYSINTLTLFGLVLSIGMLVDDAIVVVENVKRLMEEDPLAAPRGT